MTNVNNQNQGAVQTTNKKENVKMTNKAVGFVLVNSKEVVSVQQQNKQVFPVQVRMTLEVNGKTQAVSFGYSRLGGRQTYIVAEGKAPAVLSRAEFVKTLRSHNILNIKQVEHFLGQIRYFNRDEFIVSKCECCKTNYVTAANVDYTQRNHKALSEKLGREVTEFSRICYTCQGHTGKAQAPVKQEAPVTNTVSCESCGKAVSEKVAKFSTQKFGKVYCYKPCQDKAKKTNLKQEIKTVEQEAPVVPPTVQDDVKPGYAFSPALIQEIMDLQVDPYSEIAKLQRELEESYLTIRRDENNEWYDLFKQQPEKQEVGVSASEASAINTDDLCIMCDNKLPEAAAWNYDMCASCVVRASEDELTKHMVTAENLSEAHAYITQSEGQVEVDRASEASTVVQEEAKGNETLITEDTKEVPQENVSVGLVCKDQKPASISNDHAEESAIIDDVNSPAYNEFMSLVAEEFNASSELPMNEMDIKADPLPF